MEKKEFDGLTTKQIAIESYKKLNVIEKNTSVMKESLKWNWRLTWFLLTIFIAMLSGVVLYAIQSGIK